MAAAALFATLSLLGIVSVGGVHAAPSKALPATSAVYRAYCSRMLAAALRNKVACLEARPPVMTDTARHRNAAVTPPPCLVVGHSDPRSRNGNRAALDRQRGKDEPDGLFALVSLAPDGALLLWDVDARRPSSRQAAICNATCYGRADFASAAGYRQPQRATIPGTTLTRLHVAGERSLSDGAAAFLLTITTCVAGRSPRRYPEQPLDVESRDNAETAAVGALRYLASRRAPKPGNGQSRYATTLSSSAAQGKAVGDDVPAAAIRGREQMPYAEGEADKRTTSFELQLKSDIATRVELNTTAAAAAAVAAADDNTARMPEDGTPGAPVTAAVVGALEFAVTATSGNILQDATADATASLARLTAVPVHGVGSVTTQDATTRAPSTEGPSTAAAVAAAAEHTVATKDYTARSPDADAQATVAGGRSATAVERGVASDSTAANDSATLSTSQSASSSTTVAAASETSASHAGYNATLSPLTTDSDEPPATTGAGAPTHIAVDSSSSPSTGSSTEPPGQPDGERTAASRSPTSVAGGGDRSVPPSPTPATAADREKVGGESPTQPSVVSSLNDGAIAAGVIVSAVVLLGVALGVYVWYRRKYPVRMTIGRKFVKHSNPEYKVPPVSMLTLVKDEA